MFLFGLILYDTVKIFSHVGRVFLAVDKVPCSRDYPIYKYESNSTLKNGWNNPFEHLPILLMFQRQMGVVVN